MKKILILLLSLSIYKIDAQKGYSYSESGFQQLEEIFGSPQYRKRDIIEGLPENINDLEKNKIKKIIYDKKNKESYRYYGMKEWLKRTLKSISPKQFYKIMYAYLKYQNVEITYDSIEIARKLLNNTTFIKSSFNKNNPPKNDKSKPNHNDNSSNIAKQYQQIIYAGDATLYESTLKLATQSVETIDIEIDSNDKIYSIGDIHGHIDNIGYDLDYLSQNDILNFKNLKLKNNNYLIFSGDYADRGHCGIEVIFTVLLLKLFNPTQVFLLKGNHDDFNFIMGLPQNHKSIAIEIASRFLSTETNKISTLLLNYLDLVYSTLPYFLIAKNRSNQAKSLLICHGDNQNNWNDIYPSNMFYNQKVPDALSHRGDDIIVRNAKYITKELSQKGISMMIKGHDHIMPKKVMFGIIQEPDIKQNSMGKKEINPILPCIVSLEDLNTPSLGAVNIGTKKFPIIVNISGSMQNIKYYPTIVKINIDRRFACGWRYKIINSKK